MRHFSFMLICLTLLSPLRAQETDDLIHTVAAGETLISIANAYGVTLDQLLTLNNLDPDAYLQIGQLLLVIPDAIQADEEEENAAETESAVEGDEGRSRTISADDNVSAPVIEASAPMMDPGNVNPQICFIIFADENQNGMREPDETKLSAGEITLFDEDGIEQLHYTTDGESEPFCVRDLGRRTYRLEALPPYGYGVNGAGSLRLDLRAGGTLSLEIGARPGVNGASALEPAAEIDTAPPEGSAGILRELGGLVVLAVAGLVFSSGMVFAFLLRSR